MFGYRPTRALAPRTDNTMRLSAGVALHTPGSAARTALRGFVFESAGFHDGDASGWPIAVHRDHQTGVGFTGLP